MVLLVVPAIAVLSSWACGGGNSSATATPPAPTPTTPATAVSQSENENEQIVPVSVSEWKITAPGGGAIAPINAGEIRFNIQNDGSNVHEFVVIKSDADPGSFPVVDGTIDEEAAGTSPGEVEDIQPGSNDVGTMRLSPGKYVLLCNLPAHYEQGMHASLTVQ